MGRLIDADELKSNVLKWMPKDQQDLGGAIPPIENLTVSMLMEIDDAPTVDAVPVVRCKDCKHRPTGANRDDLEFPDDECPCQCEDFWYNWKPADEWYCGNGKRKDSD